jgi:hypothetical protein
LVLLSPQGGGSGPGCTFAGIEDTRARTEKADKRWDPVPGSDEMLSLPNEMPVHIVRQYLFDLGTLASRWNA